MSEAIYQLYWRGKTSGPFSLEQIKKMLTEGDISPLYQISADGKTWISIHSHPDFKVVAVQKKIDARPPATENSKIISSPIEISDEPENYWMIKRNGETAGPFSGAKMEFFAGKGLLLSSDLICYSGTDDWYEAGKYYKTQRVSASKPVVTVKHLETIYDMPDEELNSLHFLIPIKQMLTLSVLKKDIIKMFFFFGLAPLIIMSEAGSIGDFSSYFWGVYFCMGWAGAFALLLKPQKPVWKSGIGIALFTMVIGVGVLLAVQQMPLISSFYGLVGKNAKFDPPLLEKLTGFILGVGLCEESVKILPILIFARGKNYSIKDYMFLGMLSGFGFAIAEGVLYTERYSSMSHAALSQAESNIQFISIYSSFISIQLVRYITLPVLHATWCGIASWFAATGEIRSKKNIIIVGILFVAVLHGLYDAMSEYPLFRILPVAVSFMFLCGYFSYGQDNKSNMIDLKINLTK